MSSEYLNDILEKLNKSPITESRALALILEGIYKQLQTSQIENNGLKLEINGQLKEIQALNELWANLDDQNKIFRTKIDRLTKALEEIQNTGKPCKSHCVECNMCNPDDLNCYCNIVSGIATKALQEG